ncbi:uncharacterized protein LOC132736802 [Ruditapes philippinarum]|uniref:uncharacterized protein LOC132736802 n=1 Tax=Ruditapes philippinarum TaxID=129788 RepID=UPI00295B4EF4|nr:uncharacterized protein LOC132736802 [Ruditapes philippinarum]
MIILCRFKSKKSDDDKMSLKHMDTNGFKSFDGALHRNRFVEDDDDGVGSYYSRRLSSSSLPYGHQNRLSGSGNQNGFAHNGLYASPNKLPRASIHGSMPNLAGNGTSFNHFDDRRYSGDEARHVLSYNQCLNRSYDIDLRAPRNNWNGRRSPPPDYGRPRSPKPDYHGRKFNRSKDSGVGNGNSSERNELINVQENRSPTLPTIWTKAEYLISRSKIKACLLPPQLPRSHLNNCHFVADENTVSCQDFAADKVIRDLISSGHATAEPCPCIEQIIAIDETFEKVDNCYKQWFFMDGVKQMCCYSENGQLLIDSPGAGYLLLESYGGYIGRAHDICCGNGSHAFKESCESFYQINKPDDCSTYVPPVVSMSSGDPVIQTIDGGKYDFNGHGEYVFLTDGKNFEIQARTEYVVTGNKDSTYFSAFALLDKTSNEQVELHYDRKAGEIILFRNGTPISNCKASSMLQKGRPPPCELPPRQNCLVLAGGGKITILNCGFKSDIKQLVFGTDNFLGVQISRDTKANLTNFKGLAGHREDGFYMTRNKTKVSENASSSALFQFAESWSLQNESQSVFKYKETGGNYTIYNSQHTLPQFLEDKLGNLTALFEIFTPDNITLFNKTCRNYWNKEPNKQCLLTIARTGDYDLGLDVMRHENATRYIWEINHNKAPIVSPNLTERIITVNINSTWTINLTDYVTDDNTSPENFVFDVATNLTKDEYYIDNGIFTWNVGTGLREIDTGIQFIVYDSFNASSVFSFPIFYCGCSEVSFCSFNETTYNPSDTVVKASCTCPDYTNGSYCEGIKDVCPNYNCYNDVCNVMDYKSKPSWPCGPCPKGMEHLMPGYNQTCKGNVE